MQETVMRKITQYLLFVLGSIFCLLLTPPCFAGTEPHETTFSGTIQAGSSFSTDNSIYQSPLYNGSNIINPSVQNSVTFSIVENALINYSFHYTIYVDIDYYTDPNNNSTPIHVHNQPLEVSYNTPVANQNVPCKMTDAFKFSGAYKIVVTVNSVDAHGGVTPSSSILKLSSHIVINRQYSFQPTNSILPTISTVNTNQKQLDWTLILGAEEYDVEWTTINNGNANYAAVDYEQTHGGSINGSAAAFEAGLAQLFKNNASRITTPGHTANISLISTDTYLLVRMRQAQFSTDGVRLLGNWDYKQNGGTYAIFPITWNETDLNWQYSAAYAEEGKKKEVISYFDGTLRGRQTVTLNNSDNVAVAQENIYDQFGRAVASILPAPVYNSSNAPYLRYFANLNQVSANTPYSADNITGSSGNICSLAPDQLSTLSGASRYYSGSNDFRGTSAPYNNYIPDAGGYPLSVTQYTPDNTGRIKLQGGVGQTFQPGTGAAGKTTQYFYGVPAQWELDQLFGNDVGYAEHYLKNMVIDPNGQTSVSYLNASGKTIATALVGTPTAGMDHIASYDALNPNNPPSTVHILKPEQFIFNSSALKLKATTTYLAAAAGDAKLEFDIQKVVDTYGSNGPFQVCSNCYYQMTFTITDDCNNVIYPIAPQLPTSVVNIGSATSDCNAGGTYYLNSAGDHTVTVTFAHPGEYFVNIELAFNKDVIQNYTDNYVTQGLLNGSIQQRFDYIKAHYLDNLDISGTYSDCRTCSTLLGTQADFVQMLKDEFLQLNVDAASVHSTLFNDWANSLYTTLKTKCNTLQTSCTFTPCADAAALLQADVTPGGQYALFDANGAAIDDVNVITGPPGATTPNWRLVFPVKPATDALYQSELITLDDGVTVTSPYDANFTIQQLIKYFKSSWANKFLPYHPEYCQYQYCINVLSNYESWDQQVQKLINTAADVPLIPGSTIAYSHSNASDWLLSADPLFKTGAPGQAYYTQMAADLEHYSTNVLKLTGTAPGGGAFVEKNLAQFVDYHLYCESAGTSTNDTWSTCSPVSSCRVPDREWQAYRDYYFALKAKYYALLNNDNSSHCATPACPVGQPYSISLPGTCPLVNDFSVRAFTGTTPPTACAGSQVAVLTYNSGTIGQPLTVTLYYPAAYNGNTSLTHTIAFATGDAEHTFCVPVGIPLDQIKVQAVNCSTVYADPSSIYVSSATFTGFKQLACSDDAQTIVTMVTHPVAFSLTDQSGAAATSANDIHIFCNYNQTNCDDSHTIIQREVIIPHGTSGIVEGGVPVLCPTCGTYTAIAYMGVSSITGGALLKAGEKLGDGDNVQPAYPAPPLSIAATPPTPPTSCPATLAIKIPRFPAVPFVAPPPPTAAQVTALQATNNATVAAQISTQCNNHVDQVMASLEQGLTAMGASTTVRTNLRNALLEVCLAGASATNPGGLSTLASPSANGYTSFGDVITKILLQPNGIGNFTPTLNPYLVITAPPVSPKQQTEPMVINTTSTALCNLLATLNQQAGSANLSLYQYMVSTFKDAMTLTPAELSDLQNACANCQVLQHDVAVPVFLDPDATGCVLPPAYYQAKLALNAQFGNGLVFTVPNYTTIVTNYLNQQWGFNLTPGDYQDYENSLASNPAALLCNKFTGASNGDVYGPVKSSMGIAVANGNKAYDDYLSNLRAAFRADYISKCALAQANVNLTVGQPVFHYTLYYYDQADNLVRTIPPEGVSLITDAGQLAQVATARDAGTGFVYPAHGLATTYTYNATNQVTQQHSPDGGTNHFWYDILSRLVLSQNDKQAVADGNGKTNYSYTTYDALGRINEVGQELTAATLPNAYITLNNSTITLPNYLEDSGALNTFLAGGSNGQITHTWYDAPAPAGNGIASFSEQDNLRKRVAASTYTDVAGNNVQSATYYNYDLDGNVKTLWQQISGLPTKRIDYEYDLVSGKVNFVRYQDGSADQFYYKYVYDAENRLTEAWTGTRAIADPYNGSYLIDGKQDAQYYYYLHGPLRRVELGDANGQGRVQGIDYAYTLQGWLKGVNSTALAPATDMGNDGTAASDSVLPSTIAQDAYGYSLGYYSGDYTPIGGSTANAFALHYQGAGGDITGQSLYNGNISNTTLALSALNSGATVGYSYKYDQLNRLTKVRQHTGISGTTWGTGSINTDNAYAETFTYDGNGNILSQVRNGPSSAVSMDNLTYGHNYTGGHLTDNRLNSLQNGSSTYNYTYDAIGERISDAKNGLTAINWTVYGKLQSVAGTTNITYAYNPAGQRISKAVSGGATTFYVRDASGNTLALYDNAGSTINWKEQHLYGSSRLGIWTPGDWGVTGNKAYELTDHRGNVLTTVTDRRIQHTTDATTVDYYTADVATASDTYSFGLTQPGRQYGAAQKYGYNGKENDNDIGNSQNYGMREYDLFANTFWSVDPLSPKYPELSSYQFASNSPIQAIDLDGLEAHVLTGSNETGFNLKYDWDAKPLKIGQVYFNGIPTDISALSKNYNISLFKPTPFPNERIGDPGYYKWRYNDYNVRTGLSGISTLAPEYYLGYGDKYISRFTNETSKELSPDGNMWLSAARKNLQIAIEKKLGARDGVNFEQNNTEFQKFAFASHVPAYVNAGVLKLDFLDKTKILVTPDAKDLLSPLGRQQAAAIMQLQFKFYSEHPEIAAEHMAKLSYQFPEIKSAIEKKGLKEIFKSIPITLK